MANPAQITFQRNAVQPVECVKAGWNLVKDQYWLFFGMCLVGWMVGAAVPLGILMGPMMCGLFLTFFKARRREMIEFGTLFKGFDYFGQSVVATLLHVIPIMVVIIPAYILFYIGFFVTIAAQGDEPSPWGLFVIFGMLAVFWLVVIGVIMIISIGFMFVYPLIVDRRLQGLEAVKFSFKAAMANFWRLLGLMMLNFLLSLAGLLLCFVGVYLVLPITYATIAAAYEQVFGLSAGTEVASNAPPPPPVFN